jgi:hypothetical protein
MHMPCTICKGELWVCSEHPELPFLHPVDGPELTCAGPGVACICNPQHEVMWAMPPIEAEDDETKAAPS